MNFSFRAQSAGLWLGLASVASTSPAWAGSPISITYGPAGPDASVAVPTLSEWGLIAMALLVAVMAYRAMRGRLGDRSVKSVAVAALVGFATVHTGSWINSAIAMPPATASLSNDTGGQANLPYRPDVDIEVTNTSTVAQKIISVNIYDQAMVLIAPDASPQCVANLRMAVNAKCYVKYRFERD